MSGAVRPSPALVGPELTEAERASDAERLAGRVSQVTRGAARAAVLGVSDGLVTNVCLILAVAGADGGVSAVRIAGFASLLAGALSMAAGEWVSVRSQVELYSGMLDELRELVRRDPALILDTLTDRLEEAGFARSTAQMASTELPLDEPRFVRFCARTVFGIDPEELGSPMTTALTSLCLFAAGAFVPLAPWFFTEGAAATVVSLVLAGAASVAVGGFVSRTSGRPPLVGAARQLLIVVASAGATWAIGSVFGTAVA